jgi:hypothetical protein
MSELKPIGCSIAAAEELTSLSREDLYDGLNSGQIKAKKRGRRTIIIVESLKDYILSLPDYDPTYLAPEIRAAVEGRRRARREQAEAAAVRKQSPGADG